VWAVRSSYPCKHDIICHLNKWTTMEKGIKYLTELAVREIIQSDPPTTVNPDEVPYTRPLLQKVMQCVPLTCVHLLAIMNLIQDDETETVGEVATKWRRLEHSVSSPLQACVSAVEKMTKTTEKKEHRLQKILHKLSTMDDKLNFLCTGAHVRATRRRCLFVGSV